jgi:hypothetical protein
MDIGRDLAHGEAIEIDRMRGIAGGIKANAKWPGYRRNRKRIDKGFKAVNAEGTMDRYCTSPRHWVIHAGHLMAVGWSGGLLLGDGLECSDLGCGQGSGAAAGFDEKFSTRGFQECSSFPMR